MKTAHAALLALLVVGMGGRPTPGAEETSERAKALSFLKDNVIGRTVSVNLTEKIANGTVETVFSRNTSFVKLMETPNGFQFDAVSVIRQTNYDLDKQGKRVGPGLVEDRTIADRYVVSERKSTKKLIGYSLVVSNSSDFDEAAVDAVRVGFQDGKLVIDESTVLFNDLFAEGGQFKPGGADVHSEFSIVRGKLRRVQTIQIFDVDPNTLEKQPRKSKAEVTTDEETDSDDSPGRK